MNPFRIVALLVSVFAITACGVDSAVIDDLDVDVEASAEVMDELSVSRGRFETFVGANGDTYFHLLAGNGEKVLASQGYASASSAAAGIDSVQANGVNAERYELREASDGSSYFVLKAGNGAIIGLSEMYVSKANAERAVLTVQRIVKATTLETPAPLTEGRFEVFKGLDAKSYFHLRAKNGEIVLQSQGYSSSAKARAGVASVQNHGVTAARYTVLDAVDGRFYFVLKATNGQVIGRSQLYATKSNAQRGVETVIRLVQPVNR
ncbi:MAG: YegP family protein [Myxococcales bacterium]|nr:YegP family protein [Myxococcales bacterium]